ncbi:unnamed protein product, partial [Ixodes persulcatus]
MQPSSQALAKTLSFVGSTESPYTASWCRNTSPYTTITTTAQTEDVHPPAENTVRLHESRQRQKMLLLCLPFMARGVLRPDRASGTFHTNTRLREVLPDTSQFPSAENSMALTHP